MSRSTKGWESGGYGTVLISCTSRMRRYACHWWNWYSRSWSELRYFGEPCDRATRSQGSPKYLSSDHDRLYQFHQWQAYLRILDVQEIKTVPYPPLSHPFVERLIGTIRREWLDRSLLWTAADLELKLLEFRRYYNVHRAHAGLKGRTPEPSPAAGRAWASVRSYRWQPHCRGLYQTPMAA